MTGKIAKCIRYVNVWDEKIRNFKKAPATLVDSIEPGDIVLILATSRFEFRIISRDGVVGWADKTSFEKI